MAVRTSGEVKVVYSAEDRATPVGRQVQGGLRETGRASDSVAERMKKQWLSVANVMKVAVVAAVAMMAHRMVTSFRQMITSHIAYGNELDKIIKQTGLAADQMQRLRYAAEQEHLSFEQLSNLLPILAQRSKQASLGVEGMAREFRTMGVAVVDSNGKLRSNYDILMDMSDYMSNHSIPDHEKLAVAKQLLGRSGAEIVPFLKLGREAITDLGDELERVGGIVSAESIAIAEAFDDQSAKMQFAMRGIGASFSEGLLPYLYQFREWVINNLPELKEQFAGLGAGIGKSVLVVMQYLSAMQGLVERFRIMFGLLTEAVGLGLRKLYQGMYWLSFGMGDIYKKWRDDAEAMRKLGIRMQQEGLAGMEQSADRIRAFGGMIEGIEKFRNEIITSGMAVSGERTQKELENINKGVQGTLKAEELKEGAKAQGLDNTLNAEENFTKEMERMAQEREKIHEWLEGRKMELTYEGVELRRREVIKEYTERAKALRLLHDYRGEMMVLVQLTAELAKIDDEEAIRLRAEAEKQAQAEKLAGIERAKAQFERYLELLDRGKEAYKEMVSLNKELKDIQQGMYEDMWRGMMESANLVGGDAGRFAGLATVGMKGMADMDLGIDPYTQQMEQLNTLHQERILAIQTHYQVQREMLLEYNMGELFILASHEAEKRRIKQENADMEIQMTALTQVRQAEMYQNNINFIMGLVGMLGSFLGEQSQALFVIERASAVASILINANKAAALALATIPPPAGQVLASKYLVWGRIMAAATAAMAIKQLATGTAKSGQLPGGAGYRYEQPEQPRWEEEQKPSRVVNVYVYGHIVDHDRFARELIPSLDKAFEDGAH